MASGRSILKWPIFIFLLLVAIIVTMIVLRQRNILQTFSFDSYANSPTIPAGKRIFTSILKKPKKFDFIVFKNKAQAGAPPWLSRVCGMPGDSIAIVNGTLFINGGAADSTLSLSHSYLVFPKDTTGMNVQEHSPVPDAVDSVLITYPDRLMQLKKFSYERYITPVVIADAYIQKQYNQPWNIDNFGPIRVPANCYFVLGDNRSNAMDSRYIGFIHKSDIIGTMLQ